MLVPRYEALVVGDLTPWGWFRRALTTALALTAIGWLVGGGLGLLHPLLGVPLGAISTALIGAGWAVGRIGGAGLGAALIGLITAVGAGIEGHHAYVVSTADVTPLESLSFWQPGGAVVAMQVSRPLWHERMAKAYVSARVRSGKGTRSVSQVAVPLIEPDGTVVGFHCGEGGLTDGTYALSLVAWNGSELELCESAIGASVEKLGRPVTADARRRVVRVFSSEQALRSAHDLRMVLTVPGALFIVYTLFAALFRRRGLESVD